MGRKKKYRVLKLPSKFEELETYVQDNVIKLTEHVLNSIDYAIDNDLKFVEVFQFKRSRYSICLSEDTFSDNIDNIYELYIESEKYELCQNVLDLNKKILDKKYDEKI